MGKPWRLSKLIFFAGRDKNLTKPRRALLRESERRREEVAGTEKGRGERERGTCVFRDEEKDRDGDTEKGD